MGIFSLALGGLKFLTGPVTNALSRFYDYRTVKAQVDAETLRARIEADVELNHIKKELLITYQGWWATRWIVPGFAYPLILWWACIIADSIYQFPNWNVARLPDPLMDWAGQIIMSFFVVRGAELLLSPARGLGSAIVDRVKGFFGSRSSDSGQDTSASNRRPKER